MIKSKPFGLTGNIGCGKSTVSAMLYTYPDISVIDCDSIAKEMIICGRYRQEICSILGTDVFVNGIPDLSAIARIIFDDQTKRIAFEKFIHPLVWSIIDERTVSDGRRIYIVESAIIYETESEDRFRKVIVVTCSRETQFRRLRENRNMTDGEITSRLAQQIASAKKESRASYVIDTDCSIDRLKCRTEDLYILLKKEMFL